MRFDQVKLVSSDVAALAAFYTEALGCCLLFGPATLVDADLTRGIGAPPGPVTLAMLGFADHQTGSPILEIYSIDGDEAVDWPFRPGQGHLAFEVDDVHVSVEHLLDAGATMLGDVVDWRGPSGSLGRFAYLRDPEGNIVDVWGRLTDET